MTLLTPGYVLEKAERPQSPNAGSPVVTENGCGQLDQHQPPVAMTATMPRQAPHGQETAFWQRPDWRVGPLKGGVIDYRIEHEFDVVSR